MDQAQANQAYRDGNNAGRGYTPDTDVPGDDTVDAAIAAAIADGWEIEIKARTTSDVTVLRNADGERMAIGGDGLGRGAWAVDITDAS